MKPLFAAVLVLHGLIHLMGTAKAFGIAAMPQLTQQISKPRGILWLAAAFLFLVSAGALFAWPRWWWAVGAVAIVVSQAAIATSWGDAKFGTAANALALAGVAYGFLALGPLSFRAEYVRDVEHRLGRAAAAPVVTEAELAPLPAVVQRYVRLSGAVGQPRVRSFRVRFHGAIRGGPNARWMPFTGEQYNFYDEPERLFLMDASMFGLPFQSFHRFVGSSATMRVKVAGVATVVDAKGPNMDEAETVTLFNDMCVFAPGALVDGGIVWREIDPHTVSAVFNHAGRSIRATLSFNDRDELVDFVSDDRWAASQDGKSFTKMRWSTPLRDYRTFGSHRLMSSGEGVWHAPSGDYAYLRFEVDSIDFNLERSAR